MVDKLVKKLFNFFNPDQGEDVVDKNGKVVSFAEINVIASSVEEARQKAYRPKVDKTDQLDPQWKLVKVYDLDSGFS